MLFSCKKHFWLNKHDYFGVQWFAFYLLDDRFYVASCACPRSEEYRLPRVVANAFTITSCYMFHLMQLSCNAGRYKGLPDHCIRRRRRRRRGRGGLGHGHISILRTIFWLQVRQSVWWHNNLVVSRWGLNCLCQSPECVPSSIDPHLSCTCNSTPVLIQCMSISPFLTSNRFDGS